ncbi:TPA: small membrane protein [Klebsiella michiganensis]|uniref:small membrane protein n=1 Tax=Klebsiella michiganensis TaxID=1134687 RepID=UPI00345B9B30
MFFTLSSVLSLAYLLLNGLSMANILLLVFAVFLLLASLISGFSYFQDRKKQKLSFKSKRMKF